MIKVCVLGLGYVGLPVALGISKKIDTVGFDISKKRINGLKKNYDSNNEFKKSDFKKKKIVFTDNPKDLKNINFYIISVPTPTKKNNTPDLSFISKSISIVSKYLKPNDIIVLESTVFPGVTEMFARNLEKKTKLINNKDFYMCYSPERINPGDNSKKLNDINKIFAIETKQKNILKKIKSIYKYISKNLIFSKNIKEAETAKAIENTQRDLNIALFNEILILSNKLNLNFNEIVRLASSKWNFIKFLPGLVGGHCLPVDPYYLSYIASKNKFKTRTLLAGRETNNFMKIFVENIVLNKIKSLKFIKKDKILLVGMSYKYGVNDLRNSLNIEIFKKIKKKHKNTFIYDPFINFKNSKIKINKPDMYKLIIFLSKGKLYSDLFKKIKKNKKINILDPFYYYSEI